MPPCSERKAAHLAFPRRNRWQLLLLLLLQLLFASKDSAAHGARVDIDDAIRASCNASALKVSTSAHEASVRLCRAHPPHWNEPISESITLVTYVDERAFPYFDHSGRLMELYAAHHGYGLMIYCASLAPEDFRPEDDARWEKVRLMRSVLSNPTLRASQFFVWFDADLIFLDLSFSLSQLFSSAGASTDVIISAEVHGGTGVANTGCFAVRPTASSRLLLERWWGMDHTVGHDQILFNTLYKHLSPQQRASVRVLPAHWLNSLPPAYVHQKDDHLVLHLMGERNDVRARIFSLALRRLCETVHIHGGIDRAVASLRGSQLGITQSVLRIETQNVSLQRLDELLALLTRHWQETSFDALYSLISEARELLLVLPKLGASVLPATEQLYSILQAKMLSDASLHSLLADQLHYCPLCSTSVANTSPLPAQHDLQTTERRLYGLHLLSLLGNDLLVLQSNTHAASQPEPMLDALLLDLEAYLALLRRFVAPSSQRVVAENQAMLCEMRGRLALQRQQDVQQAIEAFQQAIALLEASPGSDRNDFHLVSPRLALAETLCSYSVNNEGRGEEERTKGEAYWRQGAEQYSTAIALLERLLADEVQFKAEHETLLLAWRGLQDCTRRASSSPREDCCERQMEGLLAWKARSAMGVASIEVDGQAGRAAAATRRKFRRKQGAAVGASDGAGHRGLAG